MGRALLWLRDALVTAGLLVRQAVFSLRHNWGIGVLSVVLAVSLWVYVTDRENPEQTGRVPGTVPIEAVNVPPDRAVVSLTPNSISVRVRAPESIFDRLTSEDFRATVDLSDVTTHEGAVQVVVDPAEPRAEVVEVSPSEVTVRLEDVTSRTVPVRTNLVGTPPRGFEVREFTVQPEAAVVTGPERLIERVDAVEADVNLTGVRTNFQETLLLHARDERGGNIEGVDVEPESAVVQVELTQVEFSTAFIVRPNVTGTPAAGYNASAIEVDPALVVVTGPTEVFSSIDPVEGIMTEAVSIDGASADVVRTVALRLPEGARVDQPAVTVRVVIEPARGSFAFTVAVEPTNVPSGLTAALSQSTVQVVLAGTVPELSAIDPTDIVATVNLDGLDAGEHTVQVRVQAPAGVGVDSLTPARVRVTLRPS